MIPFHAPVLGILERWRFSILLSCLLGLFLIQPVLAEEPNDTQRLVADGALVVVLVACLWSLKRRRSMMLTGIALIAAALVAVGIAHAVPSEPASLLALITALAAMSFTGGSLLWHVVQEKQVRAETILGGISVYFLLALLWALIYSLLEALHPGSLRSVTGAVLRSERAGVLIAPDLIYYSVFVLGTIGPQQIHPISSAARAWTGVEVMAGQLFLVIFIARMVGLHGASAR